MKRIVLSLFAAALVGCGTASTQPENSVSEGNQRGHKAPDFTLKTIDGQTVTLSRAGKPVLLNFWATWCGPCIAEMPALQKLHQDMGQDVYILGIDLQESPAKVEAFVRQKNFTWTFLLDETGATGSAYAVSAIPTSIAINAQGIITARHTGALNYDGLKDLAQKARGK